MALFPFVEVSAKTLVKEKRLFFTLYEFTQNILHYQNAREGNSLSKYFPSTTSGGKFGNYAAIFVYVFTDEKRASDELLNKYMETSEYSKSDKIFAQKYAETVSAYYMYHVLNHQEFGCLGLRDVGVKQTKKYKKLFAANVPY
ncbi:MAG: hypothetical protein ACYDHW_17235 [Syntrophorhabdaceae bacterium]